MAESGTISWIRRESAGPFYGVLYTLPMSSNETASGTKVASYTSL